MAYTDDYEKAMTALAKIEFVRRAIESGADFSGEARGGACIVLEQAVSEAREAVEAMAAGC